jgi:predicted transcriptional regulator
MNTVTLEIANRNLVNRRFLGAFSGKRQGSFISFETPELLFKTLTAKRWELLQAMTGAGPISIREAARRLHRDVKAVHGDVQALLEAGLLEKNGAGQILFPYDAVHVDFMLKEAA